MVRKTSAISAIIVWVVVLMGCLPLAAGLDTSVSAIRAKQSTNYNPYTVDALGIDGSGIVVAIIDTGVDDGHPDLTGKYIAGTDLSKWPTEISGNPDDGDGHGTHCAGIAIGKGSTNRGVASRAKLVDVKVLTEVGIGLEADIRGLNWCIDYNRRASDENKIRVASLSLGGMSPSSSDIQEVTNAVDAGMVVVIAAGNEGPSENTVSAPGSAKHAITVAAVDNKNTITRDDDAIADYSSRGPNGAERKPNVAAPGSDINSCRYSLLGQTGSGYQEMSGTSMATPHVAGLCALVLQANTNLKPLEVKQILEETAQDMGTSGWDSAYGFGYVDAYGAVKRALDLKSGKIDVPSSAGAGSPVTITASVNYTKTEYSMYLGTWTSGTTSKPVDRQNYEIVEINVTKPDRWSISENQISVDYGIPLGSGLSGQTLEKTVSGNTIHAKIKYTWISQPSAPIDCKPKVIINANAPSSSGNYAFSLASYSINNIPGKNVDTRTIIVSSTAPPSAPPSENQPPTCTLSVAPSSGYVPLVVKFFMSASDPDGSIALWSLDVNNDGRAEYSGSGSPPKIKNHTYQNPGTYIAKLKVTDNNGATATATKKITVSSPSGPTNGLPKIIPGFEFSILFIAICALALLRRRKL